MLGMRFKVDSIVMSWHEVGVVRDGTISSRQDRMPTKLSSKFDNMLTGPEATAFSTGAMSVRSEPLVVVATRKVLKSGFQIRDTAQSLPFN